MASFSIKQFRFINLIVFNAYWYGLMLIASKVLPEWLGFGLVLYACWHLWKTPYENSERILVISHFLIGLSLESLWHYFDLFRYKEGFLPLWVVWMWLNFSLSLCHAWWPWIRPLWAGLLLGLCGAIGPYYAANKAGLVVLDMQSHLWVVISWLIYGLFVSWSTNKVINENLKKAQELL